MQCVSRFNNITTHCNHAETSVLTRNITWILGIIIPAILITLSRLYHIGLVYFKVQIEIPYLALLFYGRITNEINENNLLVSILNDIYSIASHIFIVTSIHTYNLLQDVVGAALQAEIIAPGSYSFCASNSLKKPY